MPVLLRHLSLTPVFPSSSHSQLPASSPSSDVVKSATAEDMAAPSDSSRAALESGDAVELEAAGSAAQRDAKSARRVVRSDMRIANTEKRPTPRDGLWPASQQVARDLSTHTVTRVG